MEFLNHCFPGGESIEIHLEISYAEKDRSVWVHLTGGGRPYNPLEESDNQLAVAIIKRTTKSADYRFVQNHNCLIIVL